MEKQDANRCEVRQECREEARKLVSALGPTLRFIKIKFKKQEFFLIYKSKIT